MTTTSTAAPPRRRGARTVGSIGVLAAAAAVAGLGTFGTFTDSTTPVDTRVDTGVVSIALSDAVHRATVPVVSGGWAPGDSAQVAVDLANDGTVSLSSVSFAVRATRSSVLDADPEHGLQLLLQTCSVPWDAAGAGYTCAGDVGTSYSGPLVANGALAGAASLVPGGVDHLLATASLPSTADNRFQDASSEVAVVFTGVQRDRADR